MKKNDLAEVKKMDLKALSGKIKKAYEEVNRLVLDKNMGKLANLREIKNKRRGLSQMLTVFRQRQLLLELEKPAKEKGGQNG